MLKLIPIPAFETNYIWCLSNVIYPGKVVIVDPGAAPPVLNYLKTHKLELSAIFITHHHKDHTGGLAEIVQHYSCPVYASPDSANQEMISVPELDLSFTAIPIPGHTLDHTAFYGHELVFTGDTLFAGGCGRLFEGTYQQLYDSLQTLAALPKETQVYCGHEYTEHNLQFGLTVEPENKDITSKLKLVKFLRAEQQCTLPSSIIEELNTNVFLRCDQPAVKAAAEKYSGERLESPVDVFRVLRDWKNGF
ncbi:MAG: hydroxyacylglutathione hydrolase [Gammaproteobacteria bacterium]|nr:hydroxyacylglutathione hydrolase [Gammaproteobacteria bacterium]